MRTRFFGFCRKSKISQIIAVLQTEFFERAHINFRAIVRRRYVKVRVVQVRACGRDEIVLCGKALIQIDGGVDDKSAPLLVEAGADVLVSGSYVFKAADPIATIHGLKHCK